MRTHPFRSTDPIDPSNAIPGQAPQPRGLPQPRPRFRSTGGALAVLMTLAVVLAGCGSSVDSSSTPKAVAPSTSSASPSKNSSPSSTPGAPSSTPAVSGPQLVVSVKGDNVTPTGKEMKLGLGKTLTITVTSDRAGELHVHSSPEQELAYSKGTTTLKLKIDKPGVVDVEDHIANALVAQLQVS